MLVILCHFLECIYFFGTSSQSIGCAIDIFRFYSSVSDSESMGIKFKWRLFVRFELTTNIFNIRLIFPSIDLIDFKADSTELKNVSFGFFFKNIQVDTSVLMVNCLCNRQLLNFRMSNESWFVFEIRKINIF